MRRSARLARWAQLACLLSLSGCTLLFPTSGYTGGESDAALVDGGSRDAAPTDAEVVSDVGPRPDTGPRPDAGPIDLTWPVCGSGTRESPVAIDAAGSIVVPSSQLVDALFGTAGTPEIGLVSDAPFPGPSIAGTFTDVAVARSETPGTFVVAAITDSGQLILRALRVTGDPATISWDSPYAVTWRDARDPAALTRMAMRRVDGVLRIGLVGREGASDRGWSCVAAAEAVACSIVDPFPAGRIQGAAICDTGAALSEILFAGRGATMGYATRASEPEPTPSGRTLAPRPRLSGTDRRLVLAHDDNTGRPFAYYVPDVGVADEFELGSLALPMGLAAVAEPRFVMVRAERTSDGYRASARVIDCPVSGIGCGCPTSTAPDCGADDGYGREVDGIGRALFVDAEPAGGAVIALVGVESGSDALDGTEVRMLAFSPTGASIVASTEGPEILLGSGVVTAPITGRLVPGVGMRFAVEVQPASGTMDLVQAAMVSVNGSLSPEIFVSALRICSAP